MSAFSFAVQALALCTTGQLGRRHGLQRFESHSSMCAMYGIDTLSTCLPHACAPLLHTQIVTAVRSVAYLDICDLAGMESLKQPAAAATTGVTGAEGAATTPRRSQRLSLPGASPGGGGFGGSGSARGGSGSAAKPSLAGECCSIQQDLAALKRVVGSKAEGAGESPEDAGEAR